MTASPPPLIASSPFASGSNASVPFVSDSGAEFSTTFVNAADPATRFTVRSPTAFIVGSLMSTPAPRKRMF